VVAIALVVCAAAAATMAIGSVLAARSTATANPLAGLDKTYKSLRPDAACDAAKGKRARAARIRAAALKNAKTAPPKVLKRKRAAMRRAIKLLRQAGDLCEAPPAGGTPPPGSGTPSPGPTPGPTPGPGPGPPGPYVIALGTAAGTTLQYSPNTPITASAGLIRLQITNNSSLTHRIGARTGPGGTVFDQTTDTSPGNSNSVDVTLTPGSYEIFCGFGGHAAAGMTVSLTVN
jgi:plastocyanin